MAHGHYSDIESKCGICLSPYTEPRLLDCFHSFCTPCLEKLDVHDNYLTCPLCRTNISIPEKGVSGLKSYPFNVEPSNSGNEITDICELCSEENFVVAKCLDCRINLCLNCRDYHKKLKTSQNHSIENLKKDRLNEHEKDSLNECEEHRKELTVFCKPCNLLLCSECSEKAHGLHDIQNLTLLIETRKKTLLARTTSLKSRISVLGTTTELVKQEENNYYKHLNIVKRDIIAHTSSMKEVFCNTVDVLTNKSLTIIDKIKKKDVKVMDTYLDEIEREQLSLAGVVKTSEDFITRSPDQQFMEDFFAVGSQLDKVLKKAVNPLTLHKLQYDCEAFTEATVEKLLGKVNTSSEVNVIKPVYTPLPIPELFTKVEMVHSFQLQQNIKDIVAASNDNMWILFEDSVRLYNRDGTVRSTYKPPAEGSRMLRKSADELWFWTGHSAQKRVDKKYEEGFKVPFQNGLVGCFMQNGNLLVYNQEEKVFCEVSELEGVQNKFEITDQQNRLKITHIFTSTDMILENKNSNLVMTLHNSTIVITDKHGIILDTFTRSNAKFRGLTVDNYGHILVADCYNYSVIDILSENGVFLRNLPFQINGNLNETNPIAIDKCGFLWVFDNRQTMKIYSYH
ncbi:E3 ubiquitin-protein ligase TRIM45-like [Mytilus galloprovincialis]|uniref:E3 ubiquitin-protein ligase TRIM45-like n=1 Tax=Mytilus galloprovincialis TaxID=29158 RepID=UPI003F7B8FC1